MRDTNMDPNAYINKCRIDYGKTLYGQKYHISPAVGMLNDPNGFCEYDGRYHLFYQAYPFGTFHGLKHWYHLTSADLIHWEERGIALKPEYWYEIDGCFSGNAFVEDGKLYLFYTGNLWDASGREVAREYQAMAVSEDGLLFKKLPAPVVLPREGYTPHFRDPKVWKKGGRYYMIVGAQSGDKKARILLYRSGDLLDWEFAGVLAGNGTCGAYNQGYMWECPGYAHIDGKDFLFFCPQGVGGSMENLHQCGYVYGIMNYKNCSFKHGDFHRLDFGFEFYAPQIYTDLQGRHLCIGWMGLPGQDDHPTVKEGHLHCLSLPTQLMYKNGRLHREPLPELAKLRKSEIIPANDGNNLAWEAKTYELYCALEDEPTAGKVEFRLRDDGAGSYLSLVVDNANKTAVLDRSRTQTHYDAVRAVLLEDGPVRTIHLFVDISSIEVFINEGEYVLTSRLFVNDGCTANAMFFEGSGPAGQVTIWELNIER